MTNGDDHVEGTTRDGVQDSGNRVRVYKDLLRNTPLTKREYFAAMALSGAMQDLMFGRKIPGGEFDGWTEERLAAHNAVIIADLLIAQLNKESK